MWHFNWITNALYLISCRKPVSSSLSLGENILLGNKWQLVALILLPSSFMSLIHWPWHVPPYLSVSLKKLSHLNFSVNGCGDMTLASVLLFCDVDRKDPFRFLQFIAIGWLTHVSAPFYVIDSVAVTFSIVLWCVFELTNPFMIFPFNGCWIHDFWLY